MTRRDAEEIIARILADEIQLHRSVHFSWRSGVRGYTPHDVRAILKSHELESVPEWDEECSDFKVSLRGRCLEGRPTRIILGLRRDGPCALVTIMTIK